MHAVPAVLRRVTQYDSDQPDINIWAKRLVASHLPQSADLLREAINAASGAAREQLETMLAAIDPGAARASFPQSPDGFH